MFLSSSIRGVFDFANVTQMTASKIKLVNNIRLKKFRDRIFATKKLQIFNSGKTTTILLFLQYSKICLSLFLVALESVST